MLLRSFLMVVVSASALGLTPQSAAAQAGCLSQAETASAVRRGDVLAYDEAVPPKVRRAGDFLGVRLCTDNGVLVYVVSTLTGDGQVTHTAIDAKSGRIVGKR
jgi:hypothetical protein